MRFLLLLLLSLPALAGRPAPVAHDDEVDRVTLAAVLVGDGHHDRALDVLREIDPETTDNARYHTLYGLVQQALGDPAQAAIHFEAAIAAGQDDASIHLHLAQALMATEQYERAIASLDAAGDTANTVPAGYLLRARALGALERDDEAWHALEQGRAAFPDQILFDRERLLLLIRLGLFAEAREVGQQYLDRTQDDPLAWMAVGEALRAGGSLPDAVATLEEGRLRFPDERDMHTLLARVYLESQMPATCGVVLQHATELDPSLAAQSAECFRRAGRLERALYMNSMVPDPEEKARQRLGLLVESNQWDRAVALVPRLDRLGLLDEDSVAYAVAYTHFQTGHYQQAESALTRIQDERMFVDATTLRKAIAGCESAPETCL